MSLTLTTHDTRFDDPDAATIASVLGGLVYACNGTMVWFSAFYVRGTSCAGSPSSSAPAERRERPRRWP